MDFEGFKPALDSLLRKDLHAVKTFKYGVIATQMRRGIISLEEAQAKWNAVENAHTDALSHAQDLRDALNALEKL